MSVNSIWIKHLGRVPESFLFPRKIGNPRQVMVTTKEHYWNGLIKLWAKSNLYIALFSEKQKDLQMFHTCFIDYDAHDGVGYSDLEAEANELFYWFKRKWRGTPRWIESGRGIHLYFDFPICFFRDYRRSIVVFYDKLVKRFGHSFFDRRTYNPNKITRLPNTINQKVQKLCIWTNPHESVPSLRFGNYLEKLTDEYQPAVIATEFVETSETTLESLMSVAGGITDGRRVLLWQMILPRLRQLGFRWLHVVDWCNEWLSKTGVDPSDYYTYIAGQYNVPTFPYRWGTFFYYNEDLVYIRKLLIADGKSNLSDKNVHDAVGESV